tara:strand:+ start:302 stop:559 length:258 start_codon:yes stop_codon:yes gene_type:complete
MNERVASVATVVVVGVTLPRRPHVKRGRRRWVGMAKHLLGQLGIFITFLRDVYIVPVVTMVMENFISTPKTQMSPAAAITNVSAH